MMTFRKISSEVRIALAKKNLRIQRLHARIIVLTEDLEIAEAEAGKQEGLAEDFHSKWVSAVDAGLKVMAQRDATEAKLAEIAKLVDSDWNNGTIPHSYELTAAVRRILK